MSDPVPVGGENDSDTPEPAVIIADDPAPDAGHLIVGIGASAGGLNAFKAFFTALPPHPGMAFVLVQHLDPDYPSSLAEIVSQFTSLPVFKAEDGTVARPNTVAVIPPNAILRIERGVLRVAPPETATARRSSIDTFLISLAEDQGEASVGIILAGFGTDGTAGVAAIKEAGGLTLSEAEFDHQAKTGMPQSAVESGFVDRVLPAAEMPAALMEYMSYRADVRATNANAQDPELSSHLGTICSVLHSRLGHDFSEYKTSTLMRRVRRRMQLLRMRDPAQYIEELRNQPDEPALLFQELLIGVTRFFRDPHIFQQLADTTIRELVAEAATNDEPIRLWVAGCATGEEAYSLAILFREAALRAESACKVTVFATDVDERAIAFARAGLYTDAIESDVSPERLARDFVREGQRYRIAKHIREMCVFSVHDLVKDPPFSKLDLISCRNLLIYFGPQLQRRVLATFHYALKRGGVLWLGPSEVVTASARLFQPVGKPQRIFRRLDVAEPLPRQLLTDGMKRESSTAAAAVSQPPSFDDEIARTLVQFAPAYVVIDSRYEVQRFSGAVAKFLEPVSGFANLNVFRLLHAELRVPARTLLRALDTTRRAQEQVTITVAGSQLTLNLIAEWLAVPIAGETHVLLAFQEIAAAGEPGGAVTTLPASADAAQRELIAAREKLQAISEELAGANEELQSSNEEFQSVNEELHSTIEELQTSKEELQSINEELHTVNAELGDRAEALARMNSDLANLFDSTPIATLFLDKDRRIRRFTPTMTAIFNIRDGDQGRPISDFSSRLDARALARDVAAVMLDLKPIEREVLTDDGSSTYQLRVKPYRGLDDAVDGVVITLADITEIKRLTRERAQLAAIVESSEDAIIGHDLAGIITSWNQGAQRIYGYTEAEALGLPMTRLLSDKQLDEWPDNLERLRRGETIASFDTGQRAKGGRQIWVSLAISPIRDDSGAVIGASAITRDITERREAEERAALLMAELDHRVKNILAVVSSVVRQTLRTVESPRDAMEEIEGRITAIARAHGLLTGHGGMEGSLSELVRTELAPFESHSLLSIDGDDVVLTAKTSLILGLAFHELATNAAKYGALSTAGGELAVSWEATSTPDPVLTIIWQERGGPPVTPPTRRGFGTKLIEVGLIQGLGAAVDRDFLETGLCCRITVPLVAEVGRLRVPAT